MGTFLDGVGWERVKEAVADCSRDDARKSFAGMDRVFGAVLGGLGDTVNGVVKNMKDGFMPSIEKIWRIASDSMASLQRRMVVVGKRMTILMGRVQDIFRRVGASVNTMVFTLITFIASLISFMLFMRNVFLAILALVIAMIFILWWIFPPIIGFAAFIASAIGVGFSAGRRRCFHPELSRFVLQDGSAIKAGVMKAGQTLRGGVKVLAVVKVL